MHIHNTPRGREHVTIEMLPTFGENGELRYFVERLKPVAHASAQASSVLMVGSSARFNTLLEMINRVAPSNASVLLGESHTGKELAARAIHRASLRKDMLFVTVELQIGLRRSSRVSASDTPRAILAPIAQSAALRPCGLISG